jgi:hypothetical protein
MVSVEGEVATDSNSIDLAVESQAFRQWRDDETHRMLYQLTLVSIVFLVALIGVGAEAAIFFAGASQHTADLNPSKNDAIRFEVLLVGRSGKKGAKFVSFTKARSSDGIIVWREIETYSSSDRSRKGFEDFLKQAERVIELGERRDKEDQVIGDRAVIELGGSHPPDRRFCVLWTDGRLIHVILSSSVRHVLAFEKQVYGQRAVSKESRVRNP